MDVATMTHDQIEPPVSKHAAHMADVRSRIAKALDTENSLKAAERDDRALQLGIKWATAKTHLPS